MEQLWPELSLFFYPENMVEHLDNLTTVICNYALIWYVDMRAPQITMWIIVKLTSQNEHYEQDARGNYNWNFIATHAKPTYSKLDWSPVFRGKGKSHYVINIEFWSFIPSNVSFIT